MKPTNLLASRGGRLTAFFFLYMTEGIPLGFAATAVATFLRREGVGPAEIGAFVGSFYLPWAFKWAMGPFVDVFSSEKWGRRRMWIVIAQSGMILTLLASSGVNLPTDLRLFTIFLLVHNMFGATQDVAIDALACNVLSDSERGLANGVMFGAASLGQAVGGSGVLFLTSFGIGFRSTFFFVAGCILAVTLFVSLLLKETAEPKPAGAPGSGPGPGNTQSRLRATGGEIRNFAIDSFRAFLGSRGAFNGVFFALLPAGAMCLGLTLQSNLAVELGMSDDGIGKLNLWSSVVMAGFCVLGGVLSDRLGRKRMLTIYIALMSIPVFYLASVLYENNWIMPVDPTMANRPAVPHPLLIAYLVAVMVYSVFNGLMYGTRTALFMDVTTPAVAATQFTAYMALLNLSISYSATWQGIAVETWGYPATMIVDGIFGLAGLAFLPLMKAAAPPGSAATDTERAAFALAAESGPARRARGMAFVLGFLALTWIPYHVFQDQVATIQPMVNTFYTLVFVASGLFLLASTALLGQHRSTESWIALALGVLVLTMHSRYYVAEIGGWFGNATESAGLARFTSGMDACYFAITGTVGLFLLWLAIRNHFAEMKLTTEAAPA